MVTLQKKDISMYPDGRMDTTAAAIYLGLSPKTLAMMRCAGTGPRFVKRGRVFYYINDCDTWLKEGLATTTAQSRVTTKKRHRVQSAPMRPASSV